MGRVIVLPGCMGSQLIGSLTLVPGLTTTPVLYWADRDQLRKTGLDPMVLDGTVTGGPAPGALTMTPFGAIPEYYDAAFKELEVQLRPTNFLAPFLWSYDWRQSLLKTADALVPLIEEQFGQSGPVTLVGHSQGGLISRLAYYRLGAASKGDRIDRIICLGTPHYGTFRVVQLWSGEQFEGLLFAYFAMMKSWLGPLGSSLKEQTAKVVSKTMTWPAFYELLPQDFPEAEFRAEVVSTYNTSPVYQKIHFPFGVFFNTALRDSAVQGTQAFLRDGTSVPRGRRLVCVRGKGYPTWETYKNAGATPWDWPSVSKEAPGDGTVSLRSAYVSGAQIVDVESPHDRMFKTVVESGVLRDILLENWKPTVTVVPPPVTVDVPPANDAIRQMPLAPSDFPSRRKAGNKRR